MRTHRLPSLLALALALPAPLGLRAQVVVDLQPDKDNSLYQNVSGLLSNGAGTRLFAGRTLQGAGNDLRRALLRFDVAGSIPTCATIQSVTLTMQVVRAISGPVPMSLHAVTQDWGEAGSIAGGQQGAGGVAQPGDATWIHTFFPNQLWASPGGNFDPTPSGTTAVAGFGSYTWSSTPQMVADVQGWLTSPATNFGWILIGAESTVASAKALSSREDPNVGQRPRLCVTFTVPASVTSIGSGCSGSGASPLTLETNGNPTVPNPTFHLRLTGGPTGTLSGFAFSAVPATPPIPLPGGCFVYVDPGTVLATHAGDSRRGLDKPIPDDPALLCARVIGQGVVLDGVTGLPVTSNGLVLVLGL